MGYSINISVTTGIRQLPARSTALKTATTGISFVFSYLANFKLSE